jgi:transposase
LEHGYGAPLIALKLETLFCCTDQTGGPKIVHAGCWSHVRRKFYDLEQAHASPLAREALERIAALYAIEDEIRGRPPEERKLVRQARARPLLQSLHDWFEVSLTKLSRKSDTTAAIRYAQTLWPALTRYCDDGRP